MDVIASSREGRAFTSITARVLFFAARISISPTEVLYLLAIMR